MSFRYDDGYYCCPYCGNNGDQGSIHENGTEWVSGTRWVCREVLEMMDKCSVEDWDSINVDEVEIDESSDFESGGFECQNCGKLFNEFDWLDEDDWESEWGGEDKILGRAADSKLDELGVRKSRDIKMILKTGDSATARSIANSIIQPKELDKALNLSSGEGFYDYELYLDGQQPVATTSRRLFKLGRELVSWGYRSTNVDSLEDGKYGLRVWAYKAQIDSELELDMSTTLDSTLVRWALKLDIYGENMVGRQEIKKEIYLLVPDIDERQEGKDDPEDQVVIFEMPIGLIQEVKEKGLFCTNSAWPGELIDRLTFYKCERSKLAQTLEVVFDLTPDGFLPLLADKAEAA